MLRLEMYPEEVGHVLEMDCSLLEIDPEHFLELHFNNIVN
jgi:hypothetical protein